MSNDLLSLRTDFLVDLLAAGIAARGGNGGEDLAREALAQYAALVREDWTGRILRAAAATRP